MTSGRRAAPSTKTSHHAIWRSSQRKNDDGKQAMLASTASAGKENAFGVQIRALLGVLMPDGAAISADDNRGLGEPKATRGKAEGRFIENIMAPDELKPLRAGDKGVPAMTCGNGQPMAPPLSNDGFSDAARRHDGAQSQTGRNILKHCTLKKAR